MRFHRSFLTLALIALFALVAGSSYANAQSRDSAYISRLLDQAAFHAQQLDNDAVELESYTRSNLSWETHGGHLDRMSEHVNNMGTLLAQMHRMRSEGSPWQQDAIDRIDPLLRELAHQLSATIDYGNKHPNHLQLTEYKNYARATSDLASSTARLVSDIVTYDKAQAKAKMLEQSLELPASGSPQTE